MISVITPTYNRRNLVQNTIKSVQAQTFTNWEMIVIDDGSTDDTKQAIQPYLKDERIKYIYKENSGQARSLNFGVNHAKGEFIVFLDSDDEAYSNWLQTAFDNINNNTGIVCAGAVRKFADGTSVKEGLADYTFFGETKRMRFTCGSLFMRRNIFLAIGGYDGDMKSNIQTDLGYRLIEYLHNSKYTSIPLNDKYLVQINIHEGERIRTNWQKRKEGGIQFLHKHYNFIRKNDKKEIANLCSTIAFSTYKLKQRKESLKYLLKAIKYRPLRSVNYLRIIKYAFL